MRVRESEYTPPINRLTVYNDLQAAPDADGR